jgi:hypothetical protein
MGAKNNGVFIVKTDGNKIVDKKATTIVIDKNSINFSKLPRRLDRHRRRNIERYKLAKRLLFKLIDIKEYLDYQKIESKFESLWNQNRENKEEKLKRYKSYIKNNFLSSLLKNRGFDRANGEFEKLNDKTIKFLNEYNKQNLNIENIASVDNFMEYINSFTDKEELLEKLNEYKNLLQNLYDDFTYFINRKNILNDIEKLQTKTFKSFSTNTEPYFRKLFDKYNINYEKKQGRIDKKQLLENKLDLSKIDFEKEKRKLQKLDFAKYLDFFEDIENDLKSSKDKETDSSITGLILNTIDGLINGAKPREMYLNDIKNIINDFVLEDKQKELFNIVGNVSNLQLRALRKYFNGKSNDILDEKKLSIVLYRYFISRHYNKEYEKQRKKELFKELSKYIKPSKKKNQKDLQNYKKYLDGGIYNAKEFLKNTNPELTIPPYEDMNNRHTYKCNSMLIKPELITDELKYAIDTILKNENFSSLLINNDGKLEKEEAFRIKPTKGNKYIKTDFTYSKYLQRILDINSKKIEKTKHPRNVFKHKKGNYTFYKNLLGNNYESFKKFAENYYKEEELIINGIFDEQNSIFTKCNTNTPTKAKVKHELINHIYSTSFTRENINEFEAYLKNTKIKNKQIQTYLEKLNELYKKHQNSFFKDLNEAKILKTNNEKIEKEFETALDDIKNLFDEFKKQEFLKDSFLNKEEYFEIDKNITTKKGKIIYKNLQRFTNALLQTYNILFNDISGFHKNCKHCIEENSIRSNEDNPIAKRLLSDVAKPINGKLDMMLDRVAFEIIKQLDVELLKNVDEVEILLEQNKFKFEENLIDINIKKEPPKSKEQKETLEHTICPYIQDRDIKINDTNKEYDHIISQSSSKNKNKQIYNSEANLMLCSREGNEQKSDDTLPLENLNQNHLKEVFGTNNIDEIKQKIKQVWDDKNSNLQKERYTNFKNLSFVEKRAFRYALFLDEEDSYFQRAEELLNTEQKTITNGTQKRLTRLIYQKLPFKLNKINVKVVDSKVVSATRLELGTNQNAGEELIEGLWKEEHQKPFSHTVDALVVFALANNLQQDDYINLAKEIKEKWSETKVYSKQWNETQNPKYKIESKRLFDQKDIGVGYLQLKKETTTDKKGKEKIIFKKGIIKDSFVDSNFTNKDFEYLKKIGILKEITANRNETKETLYQVDKNKLYATLFDNKKEVLKNYSHYNKLTNELRYTYLKSDPFDELDRFLTPKKPDDKKAVKKIIKKELPNLDDINFNNLIAWFSRRNKLDKNGAKLGYYKSWEIFTKILIDNKESIFKEIQKVDKDNKNYTIICCDKNEALNKLKNKLFKITHQRKRKVKKEYSLFSASKNDTQYIHRRKNNEGEWIYQTRIVNSQYKKKAFDEKGNYFLKNSKNIIPLTMSNYKKAF